MNEPWLADISDAFAVQHDSGEHTVVKDEAVNNVDIEEMIQNMTLSDLIGQMSQIDICQLVYANATTSGGTTNNVTAILNQTALDYYIGTIGIGSVYNLIESRVGLTTKASWTALTYRSIMIQIQNTARRYHRPPVLWGLDSIHGGNFIHGATVSPQPLNIAATFNRTTAHVVGQMSSRDTRAAGVQWIFTPLLGLGLEPRWSRFYETFGEDPLVVGVMASQMIQGIQQYTDDEDNNNNYNSTNKNIPSRAAACAKHYIGYSKPLNGRDRSPSWIPTRHLFQYFVPPWFRVLQKDVNVLSIMESYTEIDGVPMVANTAALNTLLRHQLNFTGVLLTDFQEMEHLYTWHHIASNLSDAISYAFEKGSVDVSMIPFDVENFTLGIEFGIQMRRFTENRLRESVRRILQLKKELRMFQETIAMDNNQNMDRIGTDENEMLDIVHQSIVLVQNRNNFLPIVTSYSDREQDYQLKILITGPTSNSRIYQSGGWMGHWQGAPDEEWFTYGSTVYQAFQQKSKYNVSYACGTDIIGQDCRNNNESPLSSIEQAVKASFFVDIVIICIGEENYAEKPGDLVHDDLNLPVGQYDLVKAIALKKNHATKILLVYFGGRPRLLGSIVDLVDAVIIGFLPGPSAGDAIVNIVTGYINPSGRLPITYPMFNTGGYPYYHSISDQCIVGDGKAPHYEYGPCNVQWPFGHGLSYTSFRYSDFIAVRDNSDLRLSVVVTNVGTVPGAETVLFFTFDEYRRTTPEYKRLRAFEKVLLQPNEAIVVSTSILAADLRFVGPQDDHHFITDPHMSFWVGIGVTTDCRKYPNITSINDGMCAYIAAQTETSTPNIGACHAACDIWINQSGCSEHFGVTLDTCLQMCSSINDFPQDSSTMVRDGWGWNYVNCIESVVLGLHQQRVTDEPATNDCWKMTTICRDVFHSQNLDEYGIGPSVTRHVASLPPLTHVLALLAALLSTSFICYSFRRRTRLERQLPVSNVIEHSTDSMDELPYQRLEDLETEREHQLITSTMSLLGLD